MSPCTKDDRRPRRSDARNGSGRPHPDARVRRDPYAAPPRRRMNSARSASMHSYASEAERRRARRRPARRRSMLPGLIALLLLAAVIAGMVLLRPDKPREQAREMYPLRYTREITSAAAEFGVDEAYLYAVVLAESSFRPDAVSNVGAMGLMQIMPDTGAWIAKKLDMGDTYTADMLTDPAVNTRLGAWYLHFLLDRYDGDMRCASAAYHAGQGTVDKWLADPAYSSDGQTLAVIAYDSTDNYVNKVMRYYDEYTSLLSQAD